MDSEQTKHSIFAADDLPVSEKIPTPEWAPIEEVYVRTITAEERVIAVEMGDNANALGEFGAMVMCDGHGDRIFEDNDAVALGKKNPAVLQRIADFAVTHNAMGKEDQDEIAKNLETTPDDD